MPAANLRTPAVFESRPPNVAQLYARNSSWSPAILDQIAAAGLGAGGIAIAVGGNSPILPWTTGVNQISVRFDEDVAATIGDLIVTGVNVPNYSVASLDYDYRTYTATWTLAEPITADRVTVSLAGVRDLAGNNVTSVAPFTVLALAGDVDRNGNVDQADFQSNRAAQFMALGDVGYDIFQDTDTSGAVNVLDWQNVHARRGTTLSPSPSPAGAPAPVFAVASAVSPRRLAASRHILSTGLRLRLPPDAVDQLLSRRNTETADASPTEVRAGQQSLRLASRRHVLRTAAATDTYF